MNQPPLRLDIPHPCDQPWSMMERQAHQPNVKQCHRCAAPVIDFTKFSDEELFDFFRNYQPQGHQLCGRFLKTQLHRDIHPKPSTHRGLRWTRMAAVFLSSLFLPALLSAQTQPSDGAYADATTHSTRQHKFKPDTDGVKKETKKRKRNKRPFRLFRRRYVLTGCPVF